VRDSLSDEPNQLTPCLPRRPCVHSFEASFAARWRLSDNSASGQCWPSANLARRCITCCGDEESWLAGVSQVMQGMVVPPSAITGRGGQRRRVIVSTRLRSGFSRGAPGEPQLPPEGLGHRQSGGRPGSRRPSIPSKIFLRANQLISLLKSCEQALDEFTACRLRRRLHKN
jgi:hypothetical protein